MGGEGRGGWRGGDGDTVRDGGPGPRRPGGVQRRRRVERGRGGAADPGEAAAPGERRQQRLLLPGPIRVPRQEDRWARRPLYGRRRLRKYAPFSFHLSPGESGSFFDGNGRVWPCAIVGRGHFEVFFGRG